MEVEYVKKSLKKILCGILITAMAPVQLMVFHVQSVHAADEFDSMRLKWVDMLTGGNRLQHFRS